MTNHTHRTAKASGRRRVTVVLVAVLGALCLTATAASAAPPPLLTKTPEDGKPGAGAGRMNLPLGVAADRSLPGHIYVADFGNARIDEFTAWGQFVKAWGWKVDKGAPEEELQRCTAPSGCQVGSKGGGSGQFSVPQAIAVDGEGDVYVVESGNHRVQKFDPSGGPGEDEAQFVLMFGLDVNKTKVEEGAPQAQRNLCTAASGDVCQAGAEGTGPGRIGASNYSGMTASPTTNAVFIGEGEAIQVFNSDGSFKEAIEGGDIAGKSVQALASDMSGNLYAAFQEQAEVHKLKASGPTAQFLGPEFKPESPALRPDALALDGSGNLYFSVSQNDNVQEPNTSVPIPARVYEYDASGKCLTCGEDGEEEAVFETPPGKPGEVVVKGRPGFDRTSTSQLYALAASSACQTDGAYVVHFNPNNGNGEQSFLNVWGEIPDPALCPPPPSPPSIDAQFALWAETTKAMVQAQINPHFWSGDAGATTYYLQYATEACFQSGGWAAPCVKETPEPPSSLLGGDAVDLDVATEPILLEGLTPATTYRYRFAAEGSGAPGEEIFGAGGTPGIPGKDATFRTFAKAGAGDPCPANAAFRGGPSALLPDCRAFEMVSPLDKEGGDIAVLAELTTTLPAVLNQSAVDGGRVAYGSYRTFAGAAASPYTTQYIAARKAGVAWQTHPISPPRGKAFIHGALEQFDSEFRIFSPDLCTGWLRNFGEPPLEPLAPSGAKNLYRRTDSECGGPDYQALNRTSPPNLSAEEFRMELQGVSGDGQSTVFVANDVLAEGGTAGNENHFQLYGSRGGEEHFLCVLPGGGEWTGTCTAGGNVGAVGSGAARMANVSGALSDSGNRAYWTAGGSTAPIYLRENPFGEGSECVEAGFPCTITVSRAAEEEAGTVGVGSQFWAAAKDGSRALFTTGGRLYEFRLEDESTHLIAGEVLGLLGQSADARRIYLTSREAKGGPNGEGKSAVAGEPNLYLFEEGAFHFIGALGSGDLGNLSPIAAEPAHHTARVSPDGLHAAFMSSAQMTGYDNTDAVSGKADAEVFLYDAGANEGKGSLLCASCDPSGARPQGTLAREGAPIQAAAKIPVFEDTLYAARVLSDNGQRLYFESYSPLVLRDTNGQKDVYQWEAPGSGGCSQASPAISPQNGGCVELISSGQSRRESSFLDASPSGHDVFFTTLSSLLPQDPGLVDVYDAREGGGLPAPPSAPLSCEGETCQHPTPPAEFQTPSTATFRGPGSPLHKATRHKSKKKKHKHKARQHRRAHHNRGATR